jgi:cytochrome c peroxidase
MHVGSRSSPREATGSSIRLPIARHRSTLVLASICALSTCAEPVSNATNVEPPAAFARDEGLLFERERDSLVAEVRRLAVVEELTPLPPGPSVRRELVRLGQALAFDPILSGNRDISCMTCHHPTLATGDARHLAIGQGATGLGARRVHPDNLFIPRNSPSLFNLHALNRLFWDGRVTVENGTVTTPAGAQLTPAMIAVAEFGAISFLPMFPVTSREEMRGFQNGPTLTADRRPRPDNELARIPDSDFTGIWAALMARLGRIREYRQMFEAAYPGTPFETMTFAHASNAMAGFFVDRLDFYRTPWDLFLAGEDRALTRLQLHGALAFMSEEAKCSSCHSGAALSDQSFVNTALAQFGPGQGDGPGRNDDFGRERVTGVLTDRYRFRTTPLRNIELTGPFGHAGQFVALRDFVRHYSDPDAQLRSYDTSQIERLLRGTVVPNTEEVIANRSGRLDGVQFTEVQAVLITEFLRALTDPRARDLTSLIPFRVPSGLPVERR